MFAQVYSILIHVHVCTEPQNNRYTIARFKLIFSVVLVLYLSNAFDSIDILSDTDKIYKIRQYILNNDVFTTRKKEQFYSKLAIFELQYCHKHILLIYNIRGCAEIMKDVQVNSLLYFNC